MLVQATNVDIAYGSFYIGFVNRKKNAMYSFWGDDIPVTPNPTYFPKTKYDFSMSYEVQPFDSLHLDSGGHGYSSGGLVVGPMSNSTLVFNYSNFNNAELSPFGYGYYCGGITCPTGNININIPTYTFDGVVL